MQWRRTVSAGWMIALLVGCSWAPVTDGFHAELPKPGTPAIVWGNDHNAVGTAATWLQKRGLSIVERSMLASTPDIESAGVTHRLKAEAAVLQAAKGLNVQEVVFVDRGGDERAPMINVRGVRVDTGQVRWSGSARYAAFKTRPPKDTLANLTCQALATAWDFRPPGTKWFTSSQKMCTIGTANP